VDLKELLLPDFKQFDLELVFFLLTTFLLFLRALSFFITAKFISLSAAFLLLTVFFSEQLHLLLAAIFFFSTSYISLR